MNIYKRIYCYLYDKITDLKDNLILLFWWVKGDTYYFDKQEIMIEVNDFVEAFDNTGKRWTAFIKRRIFKGYHNECFNFLGYTFIFVFSSNYVTWLNREYCKELKIIKKFKN